MARIMLRKCLLLKSYGLFETMRRSSAAVTPPEPAAKDIISAGQTKEKSSKQQLALGPDLNYFLQMQQSASQKSTKFKSQIEAIESLKDEGLRLYIETYGCQMNVSDSEVVLSILAAAGYQQVKQPDVADLILLNTCAIREKPETKVWHRLREIKNIRQRNKDRKIVVGVLGCMAERLKEKLLNQDRLADIVAGPDAYRDLPRLISIIKDDSKKEEGEREWAINTQLSLEETYADVTPLRTSGKASAFLSIMRGCNNMCSFCIVPFTRGRERSRPISSILEEVRTLRDSRVKDITLLGQNVNSYADFSLAPTTSQVPNTTSPSQNDAYSVYADGFRSVYKPKRDGSVSFAELLEAVAQVDPEIRIRFTSPHPKDFSDDVLEVVNNYPNICKQLHVPAQSGSTSVLERMRRGYTRGAYDNLIKKIRNSIPNVCLSTDIIVGFCGESEEEHLDTVSLMKEVIFDQAFLFKYSQREKTSAYRHLKDDVEEEVKSRRLGDVIKVYRENLDLRNKAEIGKIHLVLVEEIARKSKNCYTGKTDTMKRVVFPTSPLYHSSLEYLKHRNTAGAVTVAVRGDVDNFIYNNVEVGDYVAVEIESATLSTLYGKNLGKIKLREFYNFFGSCIGS